ncbi:MAG: sodium/proline symporter, partial [Hyphomonadaceae bacterium]
AAGLSVIGQPHIMVRFMALKTSDDVHQARVWYYLYFIAFYGLATIAGLMSRLYLPDLAALDPELALPTMAVHLLPAALVGVILAGIFAATMSTADSLVLACSASLTHDIAPNRLERPWTMKAATALVTIVALIFALSGTHSVFALVILAWSTLACAFAPILMLFALGRRIGEWQAIGLMLLGVAIAFAWRMQGWQDAVYEGLPGIAIPAILAFILSKRAGSAALERAQPVSVR